MSATGKIRRYTRDASDADQLGPELARVKEPWRPCIGCGRQRVRGRHYCRACQLRLRAGGAVDVVDFPTTRELRAAGILSWTGGGR